MVKYGNTKIPVIKIPKGTLLFRAVLNPESDFEGVNNCIPPHYNVFFYFSPFVVDGISKWHSDKDDMTIYVTTHDIKIVSLISPSKFTRNTRLTKKQFMVPCNKTRKACLTPRVYDPCFRDTFLEKNPSLLGWVSVSYDDVRMYKEAVEQGLLGSRSDYVFSVKDARGTIGPPELSIYPLKKRHMTDIQPPKDKQLFNYARIAILPRSGTSLENFMNQNAEKVEGKWYYTYKA
jgi:hypothetical protein